MMKDSINDVKSTEELQKENTILRGQNAELAARVKWYEEQFRLNQHRRFGRSSEQTIPEQISFFNEAESEAKPEAPEAPEPTVEEITYSYNFV